MSSEFTSHNGTIRSTASRPGYVSYRCSRWGLYDNTVGDTGWHDCYWWMDRDLLPPAALAAGRDHVAAQHAAEEAVDDMAEEKRWLAIMSHRGCRVRGGRVR